MDKKNVRIRLFKDNSRYKGDLFVSVNGVSYKIRRGVEVEVPPEVAEVLEHSQVQDERTAARIAAAERIERMTVGQALERAEELRPGCKVDSRTRQRWLCEEDGMLRALLFSGCGMRAGVGADLAWPAEGGLDDAVELLVPVPFDALYPHYLCAKLDAALGETERYAGEQARYNSILAELSAWLRRREKPKRGAQWRW